MNKEGPKENDNEGRDQTGKIHPFQVHVLTYGESKKFWQEPIAYFPFIRHGPTENDSSNDSSVFVRVFVVARSCYRAVGTELLPSNDRIVHT
jgi:hypothetical protein